MTWKTDKSLAPAENRILTVQSVLSRYRGSLLRDRKWDGVDGDETVKLPHAPDLKDDENSERQ
jgi:hypothetical protein